MKFTMKQLLQSLALPIAMGSLSFATSASPLSLENYQEQGGAITVHYRGAVVDPYFAIKALLTAHAAGLDIQETGMRWIQWLLPHQQANGLFNRYCKQADGVWVSCKEADADDALLAMWIEFIYLMSPSTGISEEQRNSLKKAWQQLDLLLDHKNGIYTISQDKQVGLFMDNIEIAAAFRAIAREQRRLKDFAGADLTMRKERSLLANIERVFRPVKSEPYKVSTQNIPASEHRLYPQALAQLYPLLHAIENDNRKSRKAFDLWLSFYGAEWLSLTKDHYPWGLVAMTARQLGDCETAHRWISRSVHLRHSDRWNVLEEAAFQSLQHGHQHNILSCTPSQ